MVLDGVALANDIMEANGRLSRVMLVHCAPPQIAGTGIQLVIPWDRGWDPDFLTLRICYANLPDKDYLDTLSRVVEGSALRSHSNRFLKDGTLVLSPTPVWGRDKVRSLKTSSYLQEEVFFADR
jgi:hypothetical protein